MIKEQICAAIGVVGGGYSSCSGRLGYWAADISAFHVH